MQQLTLRLVLVCLALSAAVSAQRPTVPNAIRDFVKIDAPEIAIRNVNVIDGTGAPARAGQTVVIVDGRIAAIGADVAVPDGPWAGVVPIRTVADAPEPCPLLPPGAVVPPHLRAWGGAVPTTG